MRSLDPRSVYGGPQAYRSFLPDVPSLSTFISQNIFEFEFEFEFHHLILGIAKCQSDWQPHELLFQFLFRLFQTFNALVVLRCSCRRGVQDKIYNQHQLITFLCLIKKQFFGSQIIVGSNYYIFYIEKIQNLTWVQKKGRDTRYNEIFWRKRYTETNMYLSWDNIFTM